MMKKVMATITLLCALILVLGGCGTAPGVSKTPTEFSVLNENGDVVQYLSEDHEEVVKIRSLVTGWAKALADRSYETVTGDEEYGYYSEGLVEALNGIDDKTASYNRYKDGELVTSYKGISKMTLKISSDFESCGARFLFKREVVSANEKYLEENNRAKGSMIDASIELGMEKIAGVWKIVYIDQEILDSNN